MMLMRMTIMRPCFCNRSRRGRNRGLAAVNRRPSRHRSSEERFTDSTFVRLLDAHGAFGACKQVID